jgi:hypothetical protein
LDRAMARIFRVLMMFPVFWGLALPSLANFYQCSMVTGFEHISVPKTLSFAEISDHEVEISGFIPGFDNEISYVAEINQGFEADFEFEFSTEPFPWSAFPWPQTGGETVRLIDAQRIDYLVSFADTTSEVLVQFRPGGFDGLVNIKGQCSKRESSL